MSVFAPGSAQELAAFMRECVGSVDFAPGPQSAWRGAARADVLLDFGRLSGIVELSREDQVVVVLAGTPLSDLNAELAEGGHVAAPLLCPFVGDATVGGAYSMNLPTLASQTWGDWRTWTLGLSGVTSRAAIIKTGSRAVKSVAGYDAHAFLAGTRGTVLLVTELILRLYPLGSMTREEPWFLHREGRRGDVPAIFQVLPSQVSAAVSALGSVECFSQPRTGWVWAWAEGDTDLESLRPINHLRPVIADSLDAPEGSRLTQWSLEEPLEASAWMRKAGGSEASALAVDSWSRFQILRALADPERRLCPNAFGGS